MAPKKRTINLSKIKDFYYGPPISTVKHGFMTFNMLNIYPYLQKLRNCCACQNFLLYSRYFRKHVFLFLKISRKPTSPSLENNEFISRSLIEIHPLNYENSECRTQM